MLIFFSLKLVWDKSPSVKQSSLAFCVQSEWKHLSFVAECKMWKHTLVNVLCFGCWFKGNWYLQVESPLNCNQDTKIVFFAECMGSLDCCLKVYFACKTQCLNSDFKKKRQHYTTFVHKWWIQTNLWSSCGNRMGAHFGINQSSLWETWMRTFLNLLLLCCCFLLFIPQIQMCTLLH